MQNSGCSTNFKLQNKDDPKSYSEATATPTAAASLSRRTLAARRFDSPTEAAFRNFTNMEWKLGLNFYSSKLCIFNPADLDKEQVRNEIQSDKYHIYMICKRKKLFFDSSWTNEEGFTKTKLYWLNETHDKVFVGCRSSADLKIHSVKDGYYNIDFKQQKNIFIKDYLMINNFFFLEEDLVGKSVKEPLPSDLQVMYIGQAFGRTTKKKIDYRLVNHDKIQKVALEVLNRGSNEEVLIIGIKVEVNDLATSFVTPTTDRSNFTLDSLKALQKKASKRITEGQEITVFEASLIKYFQPELNTEYKETFPSPDFSSYNEIYETDFDYSALTVDTRPVCARVYSEVVTEIKYLHHQHYPLTTKSDKKSLFEYLHEFTK